MNQNILPVNMPQFASYNTHANLETIITSSNSDNISWFYNSFLQITMPKNHTLTGWSALFNIELNNNLLYNYCPLIINYNISSKMISDKWGLITDFIIDSIDKGYYITCMMNGKYIKCYDAFEKYDFNHDIFIYGYDKLNEVFYIRDFIKNQRYTDGRASFSDIIKAYENAEVYYPDKFNGVYMLTYNEAYKWIFDMKNFIRNMELYLNSQPLNISAHHVNLEHDIGYIDEQNFVFGMRCYDTLIKQLQYIKSENIPYIKLQTYHVLLTHKKILHDSIKYIIDTQLIYINPTENILSEFNNILESYNIILSYIIKFNISQNVTVIDKIISLIEQTKNKEIQNLDKIIQTYNRQSTIL